MDSNLFDQVFEITRSLCGDLSPRIHGKSHKWGTKLWLDAHDAPRVHYEAQVLGRMKVDGVAGLALEIGMHSENKIEADNEVIETLFRNTEGIWRPELGLEATLGQFFDAEHWRRLSDVWLDPDLSDDDVAMEIASRLADYIKTLQPILDAPTN